jgi:gamma-glutamyltranspeptidase/glutathione hydrolase
MFLIRRLSLICALVLGACSTSQDRADTRPAGLVVGDEPDAVRAAADMLAQGGSAADAATAMYFALAVTYPIAAGLGGGGLCTVYNQPNGTADVFSFLPGNPANGGSFAVPGNAAGFAALQGSFGKLPWQRDIARAEELATTGFAISPSLAVRLAAAQDVIRLDASLSSEFLDESGHPKPAGSRAANSELGETLALIRTKGIAGIYRGAVGDAISSYTAGQGSLISSEDLAGYRPVRGQAGAVPLGNITVYVPSRQIESTNFAYALLANAQALETEEPQSDVAAVIPLAAARTLDQFHLTVLPRDLGSTGFAAIDGTGQAVACAVTMNGPLGSGHTAAGTGVTLARAPSAQAAIAPLFLSPLIATVNGAVGLAGTAAGGSNGNASLVYALMRLSAQQDLIQSRRSTGAAPYDTINMIACQNGRCAAIADPQGAGLGIALGR